MSVRRERVDPAPAPERIHVHRRWFVPSDTQAPADLRALSKLWRALFDLEFLNAADEVQVARLVLPAAPEAEASSETMPAPASTGALLAGGGAASLLTQVVFFEDEGLKDPFAIGGVSEVGGFRDLTLVAVESARTLLLPIPARSISCGSCGASADPRAAPACVLRFGESELLDLDRACPSCKASLVPERDRVTLRNGATFLLAEASARMALSIELPRAPSADELPDGPLADALRAAFGGDFDELQDDDVPAAG